MGQRKILIIQQQGNPDIVLDADWAEVKNGMLTVYEMKADGPTTSPASEIIAQFSWASIIGYHWLPGQHEGE